MFVPLPGRILMARQSDKSFNYTKSLQLAFELILHKDSEWLQDVYPVVPTGIWYGHIYYEYDFVTFL